MICKNCGNKIAENDIFCGKCGTKIKRKRKLTLKIVKFSIFRLVLIIIYTFLVLKFDSFMPVILYILLAPLPNLLIKMDKKSDYIQSNVISLILFLVVIAIVGEISERINPGYENNMWFLIMIIFCPILLSPVFFTNLIVDSFIKKIEIS